MDLPERWVSEDTGLESTKPIVQLRKFLEIRNPEAPDLVLITGMSIEKHIDKMISEAMARGEFKNLKGEGKPLDLDAYFATPEDVRLGYSMLKSNDFVPEEVDRLKEITELKERIGTCSDDSERISLKTQLRDKELALSMILERNRRRR